MLFIEKSAEPQALSDAKRRLRATPDATINYGGLDSGERAAILDSLLREQGYVCAYCTRRIRRSGDGRDKGIKAHVEHYLPQHPSEELRNSMPTGGSYDADAASLDYGNMLAVCSGGNDGRSGSARVCDKSRSNVKMLTIDPLDRAKIEKIAYRRNGAIYSNDDEINDDLNDQLHLNAKEFSFEANRKQLFDSVDQWARSRGGGHEARRLECIKRRDKYVSDQYAGKDVEPYLGAILWRLDYWIRRWS